MNIAFPRQGILKLLTMGATLSIATSASAATILFQETWSGLSVGQNAIESGRWDLRQGVASQFDIVEYPASSGSLGMSPSYSDVGANVLPVMRSTDSFALDSINELSVSFAFTGGSQYFRFGLQAADESTVFRNSYFFNITSGEVALDRQSATGTTTTNVIPKYIGTFANNTVYTITFQFIPQSDTSNLLKMYLNGTEIMSGLDSEGLDLGDNIQILAGFRDSKQGVVQSITFATVPEPASAALMLTGILITGAVVVNRRRMAQAK